MTSKKIATPTTTPAIVPPGILAGGVGDNVDVGEAVAAAADPFEAELEAELEAVIEAEVDAAAEPALKRVFRVPDVVGVVVVANTDRRLIPSLLSQIKYVTGAVSLRPVARYRVVHVGQSEVHSWLKTELFPPTSQFPEQMVYSDCPVCGAQAPYCPEVDHTEPSPQVLISHAAPLAVVYQPTIVS